MRSSWRHIGWLLITASAFAVGFYVKRPTPDVPTLVANDHAKLTTPPTKSASSPIKNELHGLIIPEGPGTPPEKIELQRNDPALAEIRKQMGHNTGSLLGDAKPLHVPIILASEKKDAGVIVPPQERPVKVSTPTVPSSDPLLLAPPSVRPAPPAITQKMKPDEPAPIRVPPLHQPQTPRIADIPPITVTGKRDPLLLKDRAVLLQYDVTDIGAAGIKYVEVWAKEQERSGAAWVKLERFAGRPKQLATTLPGEGVYALQVVLESENGKRSPLPTTSTNGDLLVEVDLTPPELTAPTVHATGTERIVQLQWGMTDKNLDSAKTLIEYSMDGQTWERAEQDIVPPRATPFDRDRPTGAAGEMRWVIPPVVGSQVQLRVTATDHAGNTATAATPTKVNIDLVQPAGRLTRVRPSKPDVERGPMPREVVH